MNYLVYKSLNFLLGGILFLTIDYCANTLRNPDLSALVSLLPLSLICGYIIYNTEILKRHTLATVPTILITSGIALILFGFLYININKYVAITLSLILWVIVQYLRIKYFPL